MNIIKQIYNSLYDHTWRIAFLDNSLSDIVDGDELFFKLVNLPFNDRWFADPFILNVTESEIVLLCEEYSDAIKRGRIAKVIIDRDSFSLKDWKIVLDLPTHLSFPVIFRNNNEIFIYPENSASGGLNLYKYDERTDAVILEKNMIEAPVTDAVAINYFPQNEDFFLFATTTANPNGAVLNIYKKSIEGLVLNQKVNFSENIARMAGDFFVVGGKLYRPAQECNHEYGHAIDIQEVTMDDNQFFKFKSIRRIESPIKAMNLGIHTLNHFNEVIVVDFKGYKHPFIVKVINLLKNILLH